MNPEDKIKQEFESSNKSSQIIRCLAHKYGKTIIQIQKIVGFSIKTHLKEIVCPYCLSDDVIKKGTRLDKYKQRIQRYQCENLNCKKSFSIN